MKDHCATGPIAHPCGDGCQMGSLAGAARLQHQNAAVRRHSQRDENTRVEHKGFRVPEHGLSGPCAAKARPSDPTTTRRLWRR